MQKVLSINPYLVFNTYNNTDDSGLNIAGAKAYGWTTAHLVEPNSVSPQEPVGHHQISNILDIRNTFPEIFKYP